MFFSNVVRATFLRRVNRFVAEVVLANGRVVNAHVANTGRMAELLVRGKPCLLGSAENPNRKTAWDLLAVESNGQWVCLVAVWANDFLEQWICEGLIPDFADITFLKREKSIEGNRFDFMIEKENEQWLIEVKSVNYVVNHVALFPDAPTTRGFHHVEKLMALKEEGWKVGIIFVTMGQDVTAVRFNEVNDPAFVDVMRKANEAGVYIKAFSAGITPPDVKFLGERPIQWD